MKLVNCEMHKVALAALVLGVFSLSPNANAGSFLNALGFERIPSSTAAPSAASVVGTPAPAPVAPIVQAAPALAPIPTAADPGVSDADGGALELADSNDSSGMSLAKLRNISQGFGIEIKDDMLVMKGAIPRKCAIGATFSMNTVPGVDGKPGQHQISFIPGENCDKPSADKAMVKLSNAALFGPGRTLPDGSVDGDICIAHSENGNTACDMGLNLKYVSHVSFLKEASTKQSAAEMKANALKEKEQANKRENEEKALLVKLNILCKQGDFEGFGKEVEAWKRQLGDITQFMAKIDGVKQKYYVDQINKAKDEDSIKDAYQAYLDASEAAGGWDTDEVTSKYADKRVEMMNTIAKDGSLSSEKRASSIRDLASDLRDMDLYDKAHKSRIGAAYVDLANSLKDSGSNEDRSKFADAEKYYNEASQFADGDMKVKIDAEIAKMYRAATDACLDAAKESGKGFNTCDALAKKEKSSMDAAIKAQGHVKTDGSLEALAGMKNEKIARFGQDGYAMNVSGYGSLNRAGGSYDATKYTDYSQAQQQAQMQMMMRQQMGGQAMPGSTGGSSGFFQ
jgi:hypothetical protein